VACRVRKHKICEAKKFIIIIIKINSTYVTSAPGNTAEDGITDQKKKKPGDFRAVNSNKNNNIRRKFRTPNSSLFPVVSNRAKTTNFRSLHAYPRKSPLEALRTS